MQLGSKAMDKGEGSEAKETGQEAVEVKMEEKAEAVGQSEEQKQNEANDNGVEKSEEAEKKPANVPPRRRRRHNGFATPQFAEACNIFRSANYASQQEKALIVNFMTGSRHNPFPELGNVASIKVSEHIERVKMGYGTHEFMLVEIHFQMNFLTGEWNFIKRYCCVEETDPLVEVFPEVLRLENLSLNELHDLR